MQVEVDAPLGIYLKPAISDNREQNEQQNKHVLL